MDWYDEIVDSAIAFSPFLMDNEDDDVMINLLMENSENSPVRRGSRPGRRPNIDRNFQLGHRLLFDDYFRENPTYDEKHFIRRFRMTKVMFLKIVEDLKVYDQHFTLRCDAAGKIGLSPIQKCTAALRMLAYGSSASSLDENIRIGESTTLQNLRKFCEGIITVYGPQFLRPPNPTEVEELMHENGERGFPGMIGSIDCMHWAWKNCPVALKGQYQGKEGKPTIVLEVFASKNTYIWHAFFGCPGSCNDINVLDRSPLMNDIIENKMLDGQWTLNGNTYNRGYLLADGIYPDWPIFMKTISHPQTPKTKLYAKCQESLRKDVERCFGILQACWQILVNPCRLFDEASMKDIIMTCVILHNMRLHFRHSNPELQNQVENVHPDLPSSETAGFSRASQRTFDEMCEDRIHIRSSQQYHELRNVLIDHLWMTKEIDSGEFDPTPVLEEKEHVPFGGASVTLDSDPLRAARKFYEIVNDRRSVRKFSSRPVDPAVVVQCIHAAGTSPSGAHTEPWTFCLISNTDVKEQIREIIEAEELVNYQQRMSKQWTTDLRPLKTNHVKEYLTEAPYLILIFKQTYGFKEDGAKKQHYYNEISTSIATGILLCALQAAGLNSLVTTPLNCGPALRNLLGRPVNEKLLVLLPVGYAADECTVPDLQRKPVDDILVKY